jgi:hypothetical protein
MPWRNNGDCGLWSRQPSSFGSSSTPPKKKTRNRTVARCRRQCLRHGWRLRDSFQRGPDCYLDPCICASPLLSPEDISLGANPIGYWLSAIGYRLFPRHILLRKPSVDLSPDPQLVHILQLQRQ